MSCGVFLGGVYFATLNTTCRVRLFRLRSIRRTKMMCNKIIVKTVVWMVSKKYFGELMKSTIGAENQNHLSRKNLNDCVNICVIV